MFEIGCVQGELAGGGDDLGCGGVHAGDY